MEASTNGGDIEQALDSTYPISSVKISQIQQPSSRLTQNNELSTDVDCGKPSVSLKNFDEPITSGQDLPSMGATASEQHVFTEKISITEGISGNRENSEDASEAVAEYGRWHWSGL